MNLRHLGLCAALWLAACGGGGGGGGGTATSNALAALQPYGLSAFASNAHVTLNWPHISGATSYNLYWSTSSGGFKTKIAGVTPPYEHGVLSNGDSYFYTYTVVRADGESTYSAELPFVPNNNTSAAPSDVTARAGDGRVELTWSGVAGATSYNVYWKTTRGVTTGDTKVTDVTSPFVLTGRTNDTPYYFAVTAVIGGTESSVSREVAAMPYAPEPMTPANLVATAGNAQVTLSWDAVTNATSYALLWSTSAGVTVNSHRIDSVTSPYVHTGLSNGQAYCYALVALNSRGPSALSAEVGAQPSAGSSVTPTCTTPAGAAPGTPAHVKAFAGHLQNTITADADNDAVRYTIYWNTSGSVTSADTAIRDVTLPYTHTGLTDGTRVYYRVLALNRYGASSLSTQASAVPQNDALSSLTFSDSALQSCVTTAAADHGWSYARQVYVLYCNQTGSAADFTTLAGIDQLPNLIDMDLYNDDTPTDVSAAAQLTNLSALTLSGMQLSNNDVATVLASMTHLLYLDLYHNNIGDLAPLQTLLQAQTSLATLYLGANGLGTISQLSGLTSLSLLWLNENNISDVSALQSLTGLTSLSLANDQVSDVGPLASLTALTELYLLYNNISGTTGHVDTLKALTAATVVTLGGNPTMNCAELITLLTAPPVGLGSTVVLQYVNTTTDPVTPIPFPNPLTAAECT